MTQEQKELLFKDLCGRLPYGVKVQVYNHWRSEYEYETLTLKNYHELIDTFCVEDIKPHLFPLSSMTEEQKNELEKLYWNCDYYEISNDVEYVYHDDCFRLIDWLNKNHFDFKGLIEKGLAIDTTGLNIY